MMVCCAVSFVRCLQRIKLPLRLVRGWVCTLCFLVCGFVFVHLSACINVYAFACCHCAQINDYFAVGGSNYESLATVVLFLLISSHIAISSVHFSTRVSSLFVLVVQDARFSFLCVWFLGVPQYAQGSASQGICRKARS